MFWVVGLWFVCCLLSLYFCAFITYVAGFAFAVLGGLRCVSSFVWVGMVVVGFGLVDFGFGVWVGGLCCFGWVSCGFVR